MTKRVAVYGGSFSPFGNHHRDVIRYVAGSGKFDEILVVPSVAHPLKKQQLPYEHRLNMTEIGVMHEEWPLPVMAAQVERNMLRQGWEAPIFTINLLRALKGWADDDQQSRAADDQQLGFIVGPDVVAEFDKWEGVDLIRKEFGFYEAPDMGLHSTQIREMLEKGDKTWAGFVHPAVAEYIRTHKLYNVQRTMCDHDLQPGPKFSALWDVKKCLYCGLENATWDPNHP